MDEDAGHAQGTGNGTGVLPARAPKAGQHVAGGVMAPGLEGGILLGDDTGTHGTHPTLA